MKKLTNLFCVLFAILVTVASCSPTDASMPDTTVNQNEVVTLKRIQEYNEVMKQQRPQSRGRIGKKEIACADIKGAFEGIRTEIILALNSKDAKAQFDKIMARVTGQDLDIDAYFEKYPTGSKRAEQALKSYLDLFQTYPDNVDDVIKITNDYVEIIESSNEFTDDEKAMIYAALMVSIYSPQIWDGFE